VVLEYYTNLIHDNRVYKLDHVEKCCDDIINKIGKGFSIEENGNASKNILTEGLRLLGA